MGENYKERKKEKILAYLILIPIGVFIEGLFFFLSFCWMWCLEHVYSILSVRGPGSVDFWMKLKLRCLD